MNHIEQAALRIKALQPGMPAWAKLEKMAVSTPEVELWKLVDSSDKGASYRLCKHIRCFFQWLRRKKL